MTQITELTSTQVSGILKAMVLTALEIQKKANRLTAQTVKNNNALDEQDVVFHFASSTLDSANLLVHDAFRLISACRHLLSFDRGDEGFPLAVQRVKNAYKALAFGALSLSAQVEEMNEHLPDPLEEVDEIHLRIDKLKIKIDAMQELFILLDKSITE